MISFIDTLGRNVELSRPFGGGVCYYIMINSFFCGQIVLYAKIGWTACPVPKSNLEWADYLVLVEMVEEEEKRLENERQPLNAGAANSDRNPR